MPKIARPDVPLRSQIDLAMRDLSPLTPLPTAAVRLTMVCLDEVMRHLPGTIDGNDPEHLHQMRVASRRLRAALRVFSPCYPTVLKGTVERARNITQLLGAVRDLDVRITHLENLRTLVDSEEDRAIDLLVFHTNLQREDARVKMVEGLTAVKDGNWYKWMCRALTNPRFPRDLGWYPSSKVVPSILSNRSFVISHSYLARVECANSGQHLFRIAVKKYKYSIELLQYCFKPGIKTVLAQCKTIQDILGLLHDYDVLEDYLRQTRSKTMPKPIKKGINELRVTIEQLRHEQYLSFIDHLEPFLESEPLQFER